MPLIKNKNAIDILILNKPFLIKRIFVCEKYFFDAHVYDAVKKNNIIIEKLQRKDFLNLINNSRVQIAAEISEWTYADVNDIINKDAQKSNLLILDRIQDPHNFGAIIRSAYLFSFDGIIVLNRNQAPISDTVINSSAGAVFLINICEVSNIRNIINELKQKGYWIYCSNVSDNSQTLEEISWNKKSVIIIGNEGEGVAPNIAKVSDIQFTITTKKSSVDSLNAAVAAGVIFYNLNKNNNELI